MAVFAISDLHLAFGIEKPMDIFGENWANYMERIKDNWLETVSSEDTVIIPGDISWGTYLYQALGDFAFIESLPGEKIILKGNHDYWWTTMNKLNDFILQNNFSSIRFLHNNSYTVEGFSFCGTRGWKCPGDEEFSQEDRKIFNRELERLELSLKSIANPGNQIIITALHFPPFNSRKQPSEFINIMSRYGVKKCIYGHLHGEGFKNAFTGEYDGIEFIFASADFLSFKPFRIN